VSTTYAANFREVLCDAHQRIHQSLNASARTQKQYFDQSIRRQSFSVGQLVWMYWPLPRIRTSYRKLLKLWTGRWEILAFHSPLVIQVRNTTTRKCQTVHIDRLVPCVSQQNSDMSSGNQVAPVPHPDEHQNTQYYDNIVPPVPSHTSLSVSSRPRRPTRPPLRYRS